MLIKSGWYENCVIIIDHEPVNETLKKAYCIFCLKDKEMTIEHVVPEFLGGGLKIKNVCKSCNSRMGQRFEGIMANSVLFGLPRYTHNINGKSKNVAHPFKAETTTQDEMRIRLDKDLSPYHIPSVKEERLPDGSLKVSINIDKSDEKDLEKIIRKKVTRYIQEQNPDISESELDNIVNDAINQIPEDIEPHSFRPELKYSFAIDLVSLRLLYMKIAYEIACYHFGESYLNDPVAKTLRDSINNIEEKPVIRGQVPIADDVFSKVINMKNHHVIILTGNSCYISLFGFSGLIEISMKSESFHLNDENWHIYLFDFESRTYESHKFVYYIVN